MEWTEALPTVAWCYFGRESDGKTFTCWIDFDQDRPLVSYFGTEDTDWLDSLGGPVSLWYGPLEPPPYKEGVP